jgi:hypothetical protein
VGQIEPEASCPSRSRITTYACSPLPTEQVKKISAVATPSLLLRNCPARVTGTMIATMIAA